jgi:hypothetical protein
VSGSKCERFERGEKRGRERERNIKEEEMLQLAVAGKKNGKSGSHEDCKEATATAKR